MFKHLRYLLLFAALCVPWATQAQNLGNYTFSTGVDANKWINLSDADTILDGHSTTVIAGSDGKASALQDIGFSFPFGEDTYTLFSVNTDGNLRLGNVVTGTANYSTPFSASNANINNPKINFLGCDGFMLDTGAYKGYVMMQNTVNANNDSLLVVEFATSTYNTNSRQSLLRWQIHLYPNGNIEVVYYSQAPAILPNTTRQVGMCVDASDIIVVDASHVATHYTAGLTTTIATGTWPDAGRYYSFTPPVTTCPAV
ncbi:MAG: hypothetical protein IKS36_07755, partial [Bacteroidales bacterium]|nr:hypothetical protein [Bacteroidales bacterium]